DAFLHLPQDRIHFLLRNRRRLVRRAAHETRDLRRALDEMPRVVRHFHLDQHVAREELALADRLLPCLHLHDFLDRHQDLAELLGDLRTLDAIDERALDALLEARVSVHDEPLLAHPSPRPVKSFTIHASVVSIEKRISAMTITKANTIAVVCIVSFRVGHDTRPASCHASCAKAKNSLPGADNHATAPAAMRPPITISTRSTSAVSAK